MTALFFLFLLCSSTSVAYLATSSLTLEYTSLVSSSFIHFLYKKYPIKDVIRQANSIAAMIQRILSLEGGCGVMPVQASGGFVRL